MMNIIAIGSVTVFAAVMAALAFFFDWAGPGFGLGTLFGMGLALCWFRLEKGEWF